MRALQNYATSAEDFESLQSHIVQAAKIYMTLPYQMNLQKHLKHTVTNRYKK